MSTPNVSSTFPDAAVERANATDYGLHASVWTDDRARGEAVARRIETGSVSVNDAYLSMWASTDAPMGGVGDSGIGRRHARHGIEKYTHAQTVTTQRVHPLVPVDALPNDVVAAAATWGVRGLRRLRRLDPFERG